jgi:hypothetical protein
MASVIKAGNATDGVQVTSDNTGILELKTGTGAGTTAVTIGTNQAVTFAAGTTINGITVGRGGGSVATNTAVGASALAANTTGSDNTSFGWNSLALNTTGLYNTAVGRAALYANTTASGNTGLGFGALSANTTGASNVAVGREALLSNTTASNNTAVGTQAGYSNTTGTENVSVGQGAMYSNTTGNTNTAVGRLSLNLNSTGIENAAFGAQALQSNTSGRYNTAIGTYSLISNTTASDNTAVGYQSLYSNTTGIENTAVGRYALTANTTASYNTAIGRNSLLSCTTGTHNTVIGHNSGDTITTGTKNTILGRYNGNQGSLDIRTASNYIVLSDGDGNPRAFTNGTIWTFGPNSRTVIGDAFIGDNVTAGNNRGIVFGSPGLFPSNGSGATSDNSYDLGSASTRWKVVFAGTGTINTSDANTKQDIAELDAVEKRVAVRIKYLIKKYRFKDAVAQKGDAARIHVGVVAQEVEAAFVAEGLDPTRYALFCSDTWYEVDGKVSVDSPYTADTEGAVEVTRLGLRYDELLAFVIAAL